MILDAEPAIAEFGYDIGPMVLTYVWDEVRSVNPVLLQGGRMAGARPVSG